MIYLVIVLWHFWNCSDQFKGGATLTYFTDRPREDDSIVYGETTFFTCFSPQCTWPQLWHCEHIYSKEMIKPKIIASRTVTVCQLQWLFLVTVCHWEQCSKKDLAPYLPFAFLCFYYCVHAVGWCWLSSAGPHDIHHEGGGWQTDGSQQTGTARVSTVFGLLFQTSGCCIPNMFRAVFLTST